MNDMKQIMDQWRLYELLGNIDSMNAEEIVARLIEEGLVDEGLMDLAKSKLAPYALAGMAAMGAGAGGMSQAQAAPAGAAGVEQIAQTPSYQKALKDLGQAMMEAGLGDEIQPSVGGTGNTAALGESNLEDYAQAIALFGDATSEKGRQFMISKSIDSIKGSLAQKGGKYERVNTMGAGMLSSVKDHLAKKAKKASPEGAREYTQGNARVRIFSNASNFNTAKLNGDQKEMKKYEKALNADIDAQIKDADKADQLKQAIFGGSSVDFAKAQSILGVSR